MRIYCYVIRQPLFSIRRNYYNKRVSARVCVYEGIPITTILQAHHRIIYGCVCGLWCNSLNEYASSTGEKKT